LHVLPHGKTEVGYGILILDNKQLQKHKNFNPGKWSDPAIYETQRPKVDYPEKQRGSCSKAFGTWLVCSRKPPVYGP
jgi:hypothetical protein